MLIKNFDGRCFKVKSIDGIKLDCMFFPHNDDKVMTADEIKEKGVKPSYINSPTVIFFNPNA
jgi:hypothetical protein